MLCNMETSYTLGFASPLLWPTSLSQVGMTIRVQSQQRLTEVDVVEHSKEKATENISNVTPG